LNQKEKADEKLEEEKEKETEEKRIKISNNIEVLVNKRE
jgi:hypothetical protein